MQPPKFTKTTGGIKEAYHITGPSGNKIQVIPEIKPGQWTGTGNPLNPRASHNAINRFINKTAGPGNNVQNSFRKFMSRNPEAYGVSRIPNVSNVTGIGTATNVPINKPGRIKGFAKGIGTYFAGDIARAGAEYLGASEAIQDLSQLVGTGYMVKNMSGPAAARTLNRFVPWAINKVGKKSPVIAQLAKLDGSKWYGDLATLIFTTPQLQSLWREYNEEEIPEAEPTEVQGTGVQHTPW